MWKNAFLFYLGATFLKLYNILISSVIIIIQKYFKRSDFDLIEIEK